MRLRHPLASVLLLVSQKSPLVALLQSAARDPDVRSAVHREFNEGLRERMGGTVWTSGCESWYLEDDGCNTTLWPGYTFEYWWETRRFDPADYRFVW